MISPEYLIEEYNFKKEGSSEIVHDLKHEPEFETKQIFFENDTAKCGEVLVGCRGEFTFICALCEQHFIELGSFGVHIKDFHLNEYFINTISIEKDRSTVSPCDERRIISVSPLLEIKPESIYLGPSIVSNPIRKELEIVIVDSVTSPDLNENEGSKDNFSSYEESTPFSSANVKSKHVRDHTVANRKRSQLHINSHTSELSYKCSHCPKTVAHSTDLEDHKCADLGNQKRDFTLNNDALNTTSIEIDRSRDPLCVNQESEPELPSLVPLTAPHPTENKLDRIILDTVAPSNCNDKEGLGDDVSRNEESAAALSNAMKVGEFVCEYCGRSYKVKSSYSRHMKLRHPNGVPDQIICKYCFKEFEDLVQLEVHLRTHTGQKRYVCRFCPKVFKSSFDRQDHINTHTGERPFKCPHCPKSFRQKFQLRKHKRTHLKRRMRDLHLSRISTERPVSVSTKRKNEAKSPFLVPTSAPNATKKELELRTLDTVDSTNLNAGSRDEVSRCNEITPAAILSNSTKEGEVACGYCGRKYQSMYSFRRHMKKSHPNGVPDQIICKYCYKEFEDLMQLEAHLRTHTGRKRYVCRFCPKVFGCSQTRQFHMNVHTGERPYKCSHCPKTFAYLKQCKSHKRKHHGIMNEDESKESSQSVPSTSTTTSPVQMELEKDILDLVSSDSNDNVDLKDEDSSCEEGTSVALYANSTKVKKFFCELCVGSYQTKKSYMDHMKNKHEGGKENPNRVLDERICIYCDKEFDDFEQLRTHIATHTGRRRFVCSFCSKTFGSRSGREFHINTHIGVRPFKCSYCPKSFSHPTNHEKHEHMHLKIKKYSCNYCDKRFVQSMQRKSHERTHTGETPFQCEECGRRFKTHVAMTTHGRRHKNIRPYVCKVCSKAFYTSSLLKDHSAAHSKERPYQCNVCDKNYTRRKALRSHMQLHSNEKKYVCNICGEAFYQSTALYSHRKSHGEKL